jgi:hypothetical protein
MRGAHLSSVAAPKSGFPKTGQPRYGPPELWINDQLVVDALSRACARQGDPTPADEDVAEAVIGTVQRLYSEREGTVLPLDIADAWATAQRTASGLITLRKGGNGANAKRAQLRLADGRPLAACVGHLEFGRAWLHDGHRDVAYRLCCGAIFEDSIRLNAHMWSMLCRACHGKRTQRRRALLRRIRRDYASRGI